MVLVAVPAVKALGVAALQQQAPGGQSDGQAPGTKYLLPGTWYKVSGTWLRFGCISVAFWLRFEKPDAKHGFEFCCTQHPE